MVANYDFHALFAIVHILPITAFAGIQTYRS